MRLSHDPALDAGELVSFLARRAIGGVEELRDGEYRRSLRLPRGAGVIALIPERAGVDVELALEDPADADAALEAVQRLLRLDADPANVERRLGDDPLIGTSVRAAPGRRVPGHPDPSELAIRALLGQQITVAAATTLARRLVIECGEPLRLPHGAITHLFPAPAALAVLDPETLPMPRARGRALVGLAGALAAGEPVTGELPGIGPWTLAYIALRSGDDDAFLPTDVGVRHGLERLGADPAHGAALAEAWRPLRGFAMAHVWAAAAAT
jgi:AraC family transcriptional regulator, regulatory protein of adaptative response / DNA-3-methyladenine glycosylase II